MAAGAAGAAGHGPVVTVFGDPVLEERALSCQLKLPLLGTSSLRHWGRTPPLFTLSRLAARGSVGRSCPLIGHSPSWTWTLGSKKGEGHPKATTLGTGQCEQKHSNS